MSAVMLVTNTISQSPSGGRERLCKLHHDVLRDIYSKDLALFELTRRAPRGIGQLFNAFRGHIDGLDEISIRRALLMIQARKIDKVFVDGSNLGGFVKLAKQRLPKVEISTFFHNVEARFFLGSLRQNRTLRAAAVLLANYLAERKSVRYSDKLICLSTRDSHLLRRVYGRSATHVAPMALEDQLPVGAGRSATLPIDKFALFVGGPFYANRAGISWFLDHVAPRLSIKICIVGLSAKDLSSQLPRDSSVEVAGRVDNLAEWYRKAHFVIAPIFDGSGMKTKVAEALMHGKKIIGTAEAFSGYEDVAERAGWLCATADDFVTAIERAQKEIMLSFDPELRAMYEEKYSHAAARTRLASILGSG